MNKASSELLSIVQAIRSERRAPDEKMLQGMIQITALIEAHYDDNRIKQLQKIIHFDLTPYRAANLPVVKTDTGMAKLRDFCIGDGLMELLAILSADFEN